MADATMTHAPSAGAWRSAAPAWRHPGGDASPGMRLAADAALAVALAGVSIAMDMAGADHQPSSVMLWEVALTAPLVLRRRRPTLAAVLVGLVCLAQWLFWVPVVADLSVLVVMYTLAVSGQSRLVFVVAVLTAELGVFMAVFRWSGQEGTVFPILMLTGTVTASWVAGFYVRTHRKWTASLRERAETAERERDHRARVAVASERSRIAREMHDVVAHSISIMITLNDAAVAVGPPGQARDTVEQASEVGRTALAEMSRLLGVLREESDDVVADRAEHRTPQPRIGQLGALVDVVRSAGPAVDLQVAGDLTTAAPSLQLAVYRIVQESLTNVLKHGRGVTRVEVRVVKQADRIDLVIRDDGRLSGGVGAGSGGSALGLVGVRERAALFDGTASAGPAPGGGWQVRATLAVPGRPLPDEPAVS